MWDRSDIYMAIEDTMLDEFREQLAQGDEQEAIDALARATMAAWFETDVEDIPGEIISATGLNLSWRR